MADAAATPPRRRRDGEGKDSLSTIDDVDEEAADGSVASLGSDLDGSGYGRTLARHWASPGRPKADRTDHRSPSMAAGTSHGDIMMKCRPSPAVRRRSMIGRSAGRLASYLFTESESVERKDLAMKLARMGKHRQDRLVDRLDAFSQSRGKLRIQREHASPSLLSRDVFHTIVEAPLRRIIPVLILSYLIVAVLFALLWWAASEQCDVGIRNFNNAFVFSVETLMTIGYGTRDQFFDDCWQASVIVFGESIVSILMDCVSLGIVYSHVSSGRRRSTTILFSDRAIIQTINDELFLTFQVVEMRRHPLLEATVRCYAVRDETDAWGRTALFQHNAMRLERPDDALGALLFLSLPSLVVHRLDAWSPLVPPSWWVEAYERRRRGLPQATPTVDARNREVFAGTAYRFPAPLQRASDGEAGQRTTLRCAYCGEDFETRSGLERHHAGKHNRYPIVAPAAPTRDPEVIKAYLSESRHEIVVLVEGTDTITSHMVRGLHSYKAPPPGEWADVATSDIVWDAAFAPCVSRGEDGQCVVDFDAFHDLVDIVGSGPPPPTSQS